MIHSQIIGNFEEAYLGIYAYDSEVVPYLESNKSFEEGIYVVSVDKNGPVGNTDIRKGDIIISIDGVKTDKMTELRKYLYSKKAGDIVKLVVSNGEIKEYDVILGKK